MNVVTTKTKSRKVDHDASNSQDERKIGEMENRTSACNNGEEIFGEARKLSYVIKVSKFRFIVY